MTTFGMLARWSDREDCVAYRDELKPSASNNSLGNASSEDSSSY